eukprot:768805-Hanusia_phi.AAC.14
MSKKANVDEIEGVSGIKTIKQLERHFYLRCKNMTKTRKRARELAAKRAKRVKEIQDEHKVSLITALGMWEAAGRPLRKQKIPPPASSQQTNRDASAPRAPSSSSESDDDEDDDAWVRVSLMSSSSHREDGPSGSSSSKGANPFAQLAQHEDVVKQKKSSSVKTAKKKLVQKGSDVRQGGAFSDRSVLDDRRKIQKDAATAPSAYPAPQRDESPDKTSSSGATGCLLLVEQANSVLFLSILHLIVLVLLFLPLIPSSPPFLVFSLPLAAEGQVAWHPAGVPMCRFGEHCYRTNPEHFKSEKSKHAHETLTDSAAGFSHPVSQSKGKEESGEEEYSSDDSSRSDEPLKQHGIRDEVAMVRTGGAERWTGEERDRESGGRVCRKKTGLQRGGGNDERATGEGVSWDCESQGGDLLRHELL